MGLPRYTSLTVKLYPLLHLAALCLALPAVSQTMAMGPVTDPGTPEHFIVNSTTVLCSASSVNIEQKQSGSVESKGCPKRVLGEAVTLHGKTQTSGEFIASRIESEAFERSRVDGTAVIELVQENHGDSADLILQADGYRIHIVPETKRVYLDPLTRDTAIAPNLWLRYSGVQEVDGTVTATNVTFSENILTSRQAKMSSKQEFNPALVTEQDKQGRLSKLVHGDDHQRLPAYTDADMQQRVEAIGARLIPAYQRTLRASESAKLNFRFQVVNYEKVKDAITFSNGIILVPRQVVERMENDSQLATILADNIACAMEKQTLRTIPIGDAMLAADFASAAATIVFPETVLIHWAGRKITYSKLQQHEEEQSGRVSLSLLHDAGYDITQAPITWWLLSSKKPRNETTIPYRARYLYGQLATTWRHDLQRMTP